MLTSKTRWWSQCNAIGDWLNWLAEWDEPDQLTVIRRNIEKSLPCGSESFLKKLLKEAGHVLNYKPQGRLQTNGNKG